MRDPKRIRPLLNRLAQMWETYPDLRLGQLILNVKPFCDVGDIYQLEDEELITALEATYHIDNPQQ